MPRKLFKLSPADSETEPHLESAQVNLGSKQTKDRLFRDFLELWSGDYPGHLRENVLTGFCVADLRDQTGAEINRRMLAVTDVRTQDELADTAKNPATTSGLSFPDHLRRNTPEKSSNRLRFAGSDGWLIPFSLRSAFAETEELLAPWLRRCRHSGMLKMDGVGSTSVEF